MSFVRPVRAPSDAASCVEDLALRGGQPTRRRPWPAWPRHDLGTQEMLLTALRSGRWTLSGDSGPRTSLEKMFADEFAHFLDAKYCVPTCNGSAAIVIALQAAGVRTGEEVLVPALTWIGCASAVLRLGAIPRFIDCEPKGLAMSPETAETEVSSKTKAILLVHPYCVNAKIESFVALASARDLALVEDCSHSHGATHDGRSLGTFGHLGIFSMQQSKVLTSGEGGAVVTDDYSVYRRLQQYRSDGRVYDESPKDGTMLLREGGDVHGANYTLAEFQAAILIDRLKRLREENDLRRRNATALNGLLAQIPGVTPFYSATTTDTPTLYRYVVHLNRDLLRTYDIDWWVRALGFELGLSVERLYEPLPQSDHFRPQTVATLDDDTRKELMASLTAAKTTCRESQRAYRQCFAIPHRALLGSIADCTDIANAVSKIATVLHAHG